jgi:hypothetical protein
VEDCIRLRSGGTIGRLDDNGGLHPIGITLVDL